MMTTYGDTMNKITPIGAGAIELPQETTEIQVETIIK